MRIRFIFIAWLLTASIAGITAHAEQRQDAAEPLGVFALGQSNAGNVGQGPAIAPANVYELAWALHRVVPAHDPLFGAYGKGTNVWTRVGAQLVQDHVADSVVIALVAVGGTRVADWAPGGRLNGPLKQRTTFLVQHHIKIDYITWSQGESDFTTPAKDYTDNLLRVYATIWNAGIHAPMIVAIETLSRTVLPQIRQAQLDAIARHKCLIRGPDLDDLTGPTLRYYVGHFTTEAQDIVAKRWVDRIRQVPRFQCPSPTAP